jgi:hypothetical protein
MSDISSSVGKAGTNFNPFPGLRPFTQEESNLFFGREGQSKSVLDSLESNRFVAVIGASGSGKSSLIYCGVVPELQKQTAKKWTTVTTRPGSNPLKNLVESFSEAFPGKFTPEDSETLLDENLKLQDWIKGKKLGEHPMLLIVDQFEEIFRFTGVGAAEDQLTQINRFVELIYSGSMSESTPIYVVLTMRSDFIGECAIFQNLTELINKSNYLIPQMTRDDFRKAIEGPIGIGGASIDKDLVEQLLDEVGNNTDQLPVLQHSLMRTWEYWKLQNDPKKPISSGDYEAIGRMEKALSDHANEAYDELNESQRIICENIFKTLTEKGGDNRGIRRPNVVKKVADISRCTVEEIVEIAELFRTKGRTFLTPYKPVEITEDTMIDISHESLMRIWDRLRLWVDEEASSVHMYSRLSEAAGMYQEGRTGLWRPPDLQLALNWRNKQKPTATWGVQYNPAFERAMVYLDTSDTTFKKEEENKIRLQRRRLRITRSFAMILGGIAVLAMGLFLWTRDLQSQAEASAEEAKVQEAIAIAQSELAEEQRIAADSAKDIAIEQQLFAEIARADADTAREEALDALEVADAERARALREEQNARAQEKLAKANEETANEQRKLAEDFSDEATDRRMLSIAKSMAVKSLQIDDDPDLKALLAFQAYNYNVKFGGPMHEVDIYSGLYAARKNLMGEDYNIYEGHTEAINAIVFEPGADHFFTGGSDGQILHWSLSDTSKAFELIAQTAFVYKCLAISADGNILVAGTDQSGLYMFDLTSSNAQVVHLNGHEGIVRDIEFAKNGDFYSIGLDNQILKWNSSSNSSEVFASSEYQYTEIIVDPDGQYISAADRSGNIMIYSVFDPEDPVIIAGSQNNAAVSMDFSNDGKFLVAGDKNYNIRLYTTDNWQLTNTLRANKAKIMQVKFSPHSKYLASIGYDSKVFMWEMDDLNNSPLIMEDNGGFGRTVDFSHDDEMLVSGSGEFPNLIARPVRSNLLIDEFCSMITRNFTPEEWEVYVGPDIEYQRTCSLLVTEN